MIVILHYLDCELQPPILCHEDNYLKVLKKVKKGKKWRTFETTAFYGIEEDIEHTSDTWIECYRVEESK